MKLQRAHIKNFRRLENVIFEFDERETVFVGPNNSGKTSATSLFRCFLGKRDFKIHDFPLASLSLIDSFDPGTEAANLPHIRLDLWLSLDPLSVEYMRVISLISDLSGTPEIGIGCTFSVNDKAELWRNYEITFPADKDGNRKRELSEFLSLEGNLRKHFSIKYHALRLDGEAVERLPIQPVEGKRTLRSLLRVDFVDAQRYVQDDEETSRGSKLSSAFATFYRENLQHAEAGEEAVRIVEENNARLTEHYGTSFAELLKILKGLGVPSAHERELQIVSTVGAEEALRGTTELFYSEAESPHSLPEAYNGLGLKNLILMAIQLRDYQVQWANTAEDRPLCHVVFIEEPEVHLHAQIQQTFVSNMWMILNDLAEAEGVGPQLVITTHSSHILNSVDFEKVRYFRRCRRRSEDPSTTPLLSISEVLDLRSFQMQAVSTDDNDISSEDALKFLKRYLTLTHCDLMFADAAILIEGAAERILLPAMINMAEPGLRSAYLTTLEVGGAYAHIFADLMAFLHIPYLVITDIDSVKPSHAGGKMKACCASDKGAVTSNGALKLFFPGKNSIAALSGSTVAQQIQADGDRFVAFQKPVEIQYEKASVTVHGRTLEETIIYENLGECHADGILSDVMLPEDPALLNQKIFEQVRQSTFKKAEFALRLLSEEDWEPPSYIKEGLAWLAKRLDLQIHEADQA
ncbi:ATP-dependent nuclease [Algihabitans sp.]|uniref:ATP-dependent nuclease n=1 Tax=Algihabitans sp. TaxID=2821514 RepID=UPI003BABCDDF